MGAASYRERLYETFAETDSPLDGKVQRGLDIGTEYLQLSIGFVTRVTDGTQEIVHAVGDHPLIQPGEQCPLEEAYCRRTVEIDSALAVRNADASSAVSRAALEKFDLGTYVGAKVTIDDEPYGTVCFADGSDRESAFSEAETHFVELFARLTERAIERRTYERRLQRRRKKLHVSNNLVSVLNRVLRHNLRNDVNVVLGAAETLQDRLDGQEAVFTDRIIETSLELIRLSETARTLEATLNDLDDPSDMDVVPLVERPATEVDHDYPDSSVRVRTPETAVAWSNPSLETAIREVLENAAEHAGDSPTITVVVTDKDDTVTIRIRDDGPGLPEQERQVLLAGEETPLVHGSGLGLWLVHWLVASVDGSLRAVSVDDGTCIEIELRKGNESAC